MQPLGSLVVHVLLVVVTSEGLVQLEKELPAPPGPLRLAGKPEVRRLALARLLRPGSLPFWRRVLASQPFASSSWGRSALEDQGPWGLPLAQQGCCSKGRRMLKSHRRQKGPLTEALVQVWTGLTDCSAAKEPLEVVAAKVLSRRY